MGAFWFDGIDDKVSIPDHVDLDVTDSHTIFAWSRWDGSALNDGRFINKASSTATGPMQLIQNSSNLARHRALFGAAGPYAESTVTTVASTWNFNLWPRRACRIQRCGAARLQDQMPPPNAYWHTMFFVHARPNQLCRSNDRMCALRIL